MPRTLADYYLKPLSTATKELLKPMLLRKTDRLRIGYNKRKSHFRVQPFAYREDGTKGYASYNASTAFFKRIPERQLASKDNAIWFLGISDTTCLIIHQVWGMSRIEFSSPEVEADFENLVMLFFNLNDIANVKAEYFINKIEPELPDDFKIHALYPQAGYQNVALATTLYQMVAALFMEQGTGKTLPSLNRIFYEAEQKRKAKQGLYKVLVVCPKNVRLNWQEECIRFCTEAGKITALKGNALIRSKLLTEAMLKDRKSRYSMVIVSFDSAVNSLDALMGYEWDLILVDESHYIKNRTTNRWKALHKLRDHSRQRQLLTGTPITNTIFDLWAQLEFLQKGLSGFTSYEKFRKYYGKFKRIDDGAGFELFLGYQNLPILKERLARIAFIIRKADALKDLPEKLYDMREVYMTKEQTAHYETLRDNLAILIDEKMESGVKQLTVSNVLTMLLRLAQITSGFIKWDDIIDVDGNVEKGELEVFDTNPKLEELVKILRDETGKDSKAIVWATFVQDINAIAERLHKEGIEAVTYYGATSDADRADAVHRFNCDTSCKVFIANPAAASTGINLVGYDREHPEQTTNCDRVIYYSQNWSMVLRLQSEDRAHRKGTRVPVQYTDLIVPSSIDTQIHKRVAAKVKAALEIQDVKEILKAVLHGALETED